MFGHLGKIEGYFLATSGACAVLGAVVTLIVFVYSWITGSFTAYVVIPVEVGMAFGIIAMAGSAISGIISVLRNG